jgi:hypothetical protein
VADIGDAAVIRHGDFAVEHVFAALKRRTLRNTAAKAMSNSGNVVDRSTASPPARAASQQYRLLAPAWPDAQATRKFRD